MKYAIYLASGEILRVGECPDGEEALQAFHPDELVHASEVPVPLDAYMDTSTDTTPQPVAFPPRPSVAHVFDYGSKSWIDPRSLDELRTVQWNLIKERRTSIELGPFTYNNMVFDGDLDAQRRLNGYISVSKSAIAAGQPFSANFILADNTVVTLTAQDFAAIEQTKVQQVADAFAVATGLRQQIEQASTKEEIAAVVWP